MTDDEEVDVGVVEEDTLMVAEVEALQEVVDRLGIGAVETHEEETATVVVVGTANDQEKNTTTEGDIRYQAFVRPLIFMIKSKCNLDLSRFFVLESSPSNVAM